MTGYLRQDNELRWYFIPVKEVDKFDEIMVNMETLNRYSFEWDEVNEIVNDKFLPFVIESPFDMKLKDVA